MFMSFLCYQSCVLHVCNTLSNLCVLPRTPYLFGDVEIEDHHAEVVHYEGLPERIGLPVLHVSRPRPQEEQVQAADGQSGEGR